ncbi:urease accessory protein UreF [Cesiribacter sp. SM1]|uniref:urease accessory protein UreF n=1 Tax=Cesiribacter sp. SM1 TaxID=2861196 RepID=UPI001CD580C9|nr:urease accessory UreF family protein [Cesiribacter sp. SM1]
MTKFARLMHLVDSSIPTGSFAYSYGLESSITFGLIRNQYELRNYLYAYLQQIASMEIPFINSCYQQPFPYKGLELQQLVETYDAMMLVPTVSKASLAQGKNWISLLHTFYPAEDLDAIQEWFILRRLPLHFIPVYALALKQLQFSPDEIRSMYLHMALRDQVSAAIRLGFIGSMEGNALQHQFYTVFEDLISMHSHKTYKDACRSAFLLDTAQVFHENVYSKLFQN